MPDTQSKWEQLLDERQVKEVQFARLYATDFHHGTDGHNRLILINFLSDALDRVEHSGVDIQRLFYPKAE